MDYAVKGKEFLKELRKESESSFESWEGLYVITEPETCQSAQQTLCKRYTVELTLGCLEIWNDINNVSVDLYIFLHGKLGTFVFNSSYIVKSS